MNEIDRATDNSKEKADVNADIDHARIDLMADSIYIHSDEIGISKRIVNKPVAYIVVAIEEDKTDAVVVMSARNTPTRHALINVTTAILEKIKKNCNVKTETIEFKSKEAFESAVNQLKSLGISVKEANNV